MGTDLNLSEFNCMVGPVFMSGIPGTRLDDETDSLIRDYNLGGIILFSRNIENPLQVGKLCKELQEKAVKYHGLPLILAVDQEGGRVARLKEPFTSFPGNSEIGSDENPVQRAIEFGRVTAREMALVGLNMDMAPVVDVSRGKTDAHLIGRTFGEDPEKVGLLGTAVVKVLQENGIMAVAKHFPGLGRAELDPHVHLPKIEADMNEIEDINIPPFMAAIDGGVSAIMTSHAIYSALDPELPATLSPKVLLELLRDKLAFKGLIITDDLEMGAIEKKWGVADGACRAFEAGADILLICNDQKNLVDSLDLLRKRVLGGKIHMERLQQTNERILRARSKLAKDWKDISIETIKSYFKL